MYTATMEYTFRPEAFDQACQIWREVVLDAAARQPGFVRMQFLTSQPGALAIGTWQDKASAEAFMRTGVFKVLMDRIESLCAARPQPRTWELAWFREA